ncbi:MAG: GNAT family N-acetyltransferase [Cytophagales bacterium]|nr:GNAT family N-acetyltransferase [Cytophagales bacterium]
MVELEWEKYSLLNEPVKNVAINSLFARAVIEKKVAGKIFVDDADAPKTYYVVHPYGMSLLFGDSSNETFNRRFADYCLNRSGKRRTCEWMQAYPSDWDAVLPELFAGKLVKPSDKSEVPKECIELNTRVNFRFDIERYLDFKKNNIKEEFELVRTGSEIFHKMKGSVVPANFWNNAEDFCRYGVGFSLFHKEKLATTAYSAFIFKDELELGMETQPEFRGKGFAQYACSSLIDYCLSNDYEPVWACKLENTPSYRLAQKLGFVPDVTLPYYRLAL